MDWQAAGVVVTAVGVVIMALLGLDTRRKQSEDRVDIEALKAQADATQRLAATIEAIDQRERERIAAAAAAAAAAKPCLLRLRVHRDARGGRRLIVKNEGPGTAVLHSVEAEGGRLDFKPGRVLQDTDEANGMLFVTSGTPNPLPITIDYEDELGRRMQTKEIDW